jgi:selenocysteine lyase/cysteine desulfurase
MPGWRSVRDAFDFLNYDQDWTEGTARFEGGTWNIIGAVSLNESIGVLAAAGTARIAAHVVDLTDRLVEGLERLGADVVSLRGQSCSSGIVTFRLPDSDSVAIGKTLQRERIVTTYRPGGVRVSPHGYNTHDEIDALIETLAAYRKAM